MWRGMLKITRKDKKNVRMYWSGNPSKKLSTVSDLNLPFERYIARRTDKSPKGPPKLRWDPDIRNRHKHNVV